MKIKQNIINTKGIKIIAEANGRIVGRAYLYLIYNDLHKEPYGLLEDVFVEDECRGQGIGTKLVKAVIDQAKAQKCYKLIATSRASRPKVHAMYERLGIKKWGVEFRMEL